MKKSIQKIALIVTLGTLLSKGAGMLRQIVFAGAFGIGAAYDAYNYAYIFPGFFLVLLGGINGPLHNAMVSVLSRKSEKEGAYLTHSINTIVCSFLILISVIILISADPLIRVVGPGLSVEVHDIAVTQLKIMSPIAFISGLIGIGFGSLNAKDEFLIPSISPLISSFVLIISVGIFWLQKYQHNNSINIDLKGGIFLAVATVIGALLQWGVQIPSLIKNNLIRIKPKWNIDNSGVKEVLKIIGPASLSTGMLQVNVITDLFFASGIIGAAAGLSYANFIVQAPLGLISNALLIPLFPTFSKLTSPEKRPELIRKIDQGLILSIASMVFLGAMLISLCNPIIQLIYERGAFDKQAVSLVSGLLIAYGIGMPAYLGRDLLVRVFYSLGDAKTPFKISTIGIILNIFLDWVSIGAPTSEGNMLPMNFGAPGIIYATVIVNFWSLFNLLIKLSSNLGELPIKKWYIDSIKITFSGFLSGIFSWYLSSIIPSSENFISLFIQIISSFLLGLIIFTFISNYLKIYVVNDITSMIKKRIIHS